MQHSLRPHAFDVNVSFDMIEEENDFLQIAFLGMINHCWSFPCSFRRCHMSFLGITKKPVIAKNEHPTALLRYYKTVGDNDD